MKTIHDIQLFLEKLDVQPADSLEDQDLDFKEWNIRSMNDSVALVIEMAVCMANGWWRITRLPQLNKGCFILNIGPILKLLCGKQL